MNLDQIAVCVDFSAGSLAALRLARKIARRGGRIRLIHITDSAIFFRGPSYGDPVVLDHIFQDLIRGARSELDAMAEELRVSGFEVELVAKAGRPADQILESAARFDLLVLGTHGRGAVGRMLLGSVAEEVARRSAIPVLVVRDGTEERPIERILVAIDPTGPSHDAVLAASVLAERLSARIEAIHAAYLPPVLPYAAPDALDQMKNVLERHLEAVPSLIRNVFQKAIGREVKVHVVTGAPAHEIARHAKPSDIIVCGTHGRSALGRFVFGSVATKLLRESPGPILIVRPAEDESPSDELAATASARLRG